MKSPARSVAWLLPFLLTGCFQLPFHKKQPVQSRMLAPRVQPSQAIQLVDIELPPRIRSSPRTAIYNMREEGQPIPPPVRHRRPPNPNPDDAATAPEPRPPPNPAVSAIGQLSSGDPGKLPPAD
jgi:hypothetical protein